MNHVQQLKSYIYTYTYMLCVAFDICFFDNLKYLDLHISLMSPYYVARLHSNLVI